jgi:hypothetical protein
MKALNSSEFAQAVMKMATPTGPFEPTATYDPDGDCIEFVAKPDDFYAERVDDLVTVYYSRRNGEVIGSLIKGVRSFCKRMVERYPGFKIEIHGKRIRLEYLFLAGMWSAELDPNDVKTIVYENLVKAAKEADLDTEVCAV